MYALSIMQVAAGVQEQSQYQNPQAPARTLITAQWLCLVLDAGFQFVGGFLTCWIVMQQVQRVQFEHWFDAGLY